MKAPQNIDELLSFVINNPHSDFYRKKYEAAGLSPEEALNPDNFTKLPPLTRAELESTLSDDRLFVANEDVEFVAYTSGTTSGNPLVIYFSEIENHYFDPTLGTEARRLLIVHPPLSRNFGHTFVKQCRQAKNKCAAIFADHQNLANSALIAARAKADAICTIPTLAVELAEQMEKYYDPHAIKLLIVSSETLTAARRAILSGKFPNAKIANVYGSAEVGQFFFYPCMKMMDDGADKFHVLTPPIMRTELIDGELVITCGNNTAMPLVRYRTGDYFEEDEKGCSCGLPGPVLSISGRDKIDKLRIGGVEIKVSAVEDAFRPIMHLSGDKYQLHFYETGNGSELKIRTVIEILRNDMNGNHFSEADRGAAILRHLMDNWKLTPWTTLGGAVEKGYFAIPEIKFVDELSLKSGKTRRIVGHFDDKN